MKTFRNVAQQTYTNQQSDRLVYPVLENPSRPCPTPLLCHLLVSLKHQIRMYTQAKRLQSSVLAAGVKAQHPTNIPRQACGLADKKLKNPNRKEYLAWFLSLQPQ